MPTDNDLHKAAHKGDIDACKMLIEGSVEEEVPITVNDIGASDRRPLHRAAGAGHLNVCIYFAEIGAEIDAVRINVYDEQYIFIIFFYYYYHRKIKVEEQLFTGQQ